MFPKNKWIEFTHETDVISDATFVVTARGWIGDRYERDYPNEPTIELISFEPSKVVHIDTMRAIKADTLEYFKVNFCSF